MNNSIDINCDLGESFGNWRMGDDESLYPLVTTASIACGFHAGDPITMRDSVANANAHGVAIGSHPGLPDLLGFGRRAMDISPDDAATYITYQTGALSAFLNEVGVELHHIKPHGAFYAVLQNNPKLAPAAARAIRRFGNDMKVYWPAPYENSAFCNELDRVGVHVCGVLFPDLSYDDSGNLVLQRAKHETDISFAVAQVRSMLTKGTLTTESGSDIPVNAESVCVHGDGPNAIAVATAVIDLIDELGFTRQAVGS